MLHLSGRSGWGRLRESQLMPAWRYERLETSLPTVFQKFIVQHTHPFHTWIGLTEIDGSWKWVDGTDYGNSYK